MKLYHATTVGGLDMLKANSLDREGNPVLYLTDNLSYSLFYIRDRDIDFVTCGVREGGIVHYDEKFPNQLETLYSGMSGWVYEVETDAAATKINGIYVAFCDAPIIREVYIPDVLEAIREEIQKGKVHFLSYGALSDKQKRMNQEGMIQWFGSDRNMHPKKAAFLRTHFPEAWQAAQNILAQSY